ncbi:MAG: TatD family hydrolase [Gammaproteobacteria bacterium]|nr:TatD family hydrolase [Gammaproteobacteria bacterium]
MVLVDSHCHLDLLANADPTTSIASFVARAQSADVQHLLNVCVAIKDFPQVLATALQYTFVDTSVGLHPNNQDEETTIEELVALGQHSKVVAIGETGLDYYRTNPNTTWQHKRFINHIEAAKQLQKPLIIHTRSARDDTIRIMQTQNAADIGGVMHCFSEDWDTAKKALDMGFYISFSGVVTFKNAKDLQVIAQKIPLDRILIETDAPYLAPVPHRGKTNEPAFVRYTAAFLAELKNIPIEEFATITTDNFFRLFKGAKPQYV